MRSPLAFYLFCAGGLFLSGCASAPALVLPAPAVAARVVSVAPLKTFTLQWCSIPQAPKEMTGLECSSNLLAWVKLCEFPLMTITNAWTVTNPPPVQFYRAFNALPVE